MSNTLFSGCSHIGGFFHSEVKLMSTYTERTSSKLENVIPRLKLLQCTREHVAAVSNGLPLVRTENE